jgi:hypothetical protein
LPPHIAQGKLSVAHFSFGINFMFLTGMWGKPSGMLGDRPSAKILANINIKPTNHYLSCASEATQASYWRGRATNKVGSFPWPLVRFHEGSRAYHLIAEIGVVLVAVALSASW